MVLRGRSLTMLRWLVGGAALLSVAFASAQEADDFDVQDVVKEPENPDKVLVNPPVVPIAVFQSLDNFYAEIGCLAFAFIYVVAYFIGKAQNKSIAQKWLDDAEPLLVKQFAYTGASADPPVGMLEETKSNFKYYCTGRRFCSRFVVDFQLASRQDLISRIFRMIVPVQDYVTIDVGLNVADMDPFVFSISKKLVFTRLTKVFPELISVAKRIPSNSVPESMCIATDCVEVPKLLLTNSFQGSLKELDDFLENIVITDLNTLHIEGFPRAEKRILHAVFKMRSGSKKLDATIVVSFITNLIDAIGSSIKLSRDAKHSAQKRRSKMKQESEDDDSQKEELARRQNELREKKQREYESLSYEEQQRLDELNRKKQMRKRLTKKR